MHNQYKIPFNKPFIIDKELDYIREVVASGKISGNGMMTKKCQDFFEKRYGFKKCLLTTSCTDALEMAALLIDIQPGDEVIMPSYTFVSTANAFVLRGAKIVFADSENDHPNLEIKEIEKLINQKTKAIAIIHYAGMACNMDALMALSKIHNLYIIEDAAQAIDSFYIKPQTLNPKPNSLEKSPLGGIGHLGCFSFHETKNIIAGEGGMLAINDEKLIKKAEIIWEKGTNRAAFFRGEVNKYGWMEMGSSFLPADIIAAFLYAQLEHLDQIQNKRKEIWNYYYENLKPLEKDNLLKLPILKPYATNNAHIFYLICKNLKERTALIQHLKKHGILAVFHYLSLHKSPFYQNKHDGRNLPNSDFYTDCLLRLPLFYDLKKDEQNFIIEKVLEFYL